jgi:hypothetical protein
VCNVILTVTNGVIDTGRLVRESHPRHFQVNPGNPGLLQALAFGLYMRKMGYRESTTRSCISALKAIARRADLLNPEVVRTYLASARLSESRKQTVIEHLDRLYKWKHITFMRPRYRKIRTLPFIPLESELDQLIAGAGTTTAAFLQLLKETVADQEKAGR